jgi:hypothetical protein
MPLADQIEMTKTGQLGRYARKRMIRRVTRSMPWIGGALALITVGGAIRRKGWLGGTLDTALDFTPFVGAAKNLVEAGRGRDFFPDRRLAGVPETRRIPR